MVVSRVAQENEKRVELDALQELVDQDENAVLGSLIPHLHNMSLVCHDAHSRPVPRCCHRCGFGWCQAC